MKKLFGFLIIVTFAFVACEGPAGPPGRDGRDGRDGESTQWFAGDFIVYSQDWTFVEDHDNDWYFFECEIRFPELTEFIFMEGAVIGYLVQNVRYGTGPTIRIHSLLPHTVYGEFEGFPYSENYSFEIRPGFINFIVKYSDWEPELLPPTRQFRIVMMW